MWAETYTLSFSTLTSQSDGTGVFSKIDPEDATLKGGGLTVYGSGREYNVASGTKRIKYSQNYQYTISLPNSNEKIVSVTFEGCANSSEKTAWLSEFNGTTYDSESVSPAKFPTNSSSSSYTFSGKDITASGTATFTVANTQGNFIITVVTEENTIDNVFNNTYPYTWQFDVVAAKWTKSKSQMNTLGWNFADTDDPADGIHDEARPASAASNTTYNIDIIEGLQFTTSDAGSLCLDWKNQVLWMNGKLTIPDLKVGMKVTFTSNDNVTATEDGTGRVTGSGKEFTVTTAGNVTFTVNTHVRSIAITKNDLTDFSFDLGQTYYGSSSPSSGKIAGAFIGRTNTFKYKLGRDQILRTTMRVDPDAETLVGKSLATNENIPEFTKSSSNESVLGTSGTACRSAANRVTYWDIPVMGCGTTNLTYSFSGSDAYNAEDYVQMITIEKDDPVLEFISSFLIKKVGEANFTRTITLNGLSLPVTDDNAGTVNVTHSSDNNSVATVNATTGEVTIGTTPGVANIKVTLAATDYNNKVEKSWKLIVNPASGTDPTLSWSDDVNSVSVPYNQNVTHTATVNTSQPISYYSGNPSIATVDKNGVVTGTGVGSTQIYALVDPTETYNAKQIEYTVTVTSAGELGGFRFEPNNGKVNNGYSITPKLVFPTIPANGVTSLKVTQIQVTEREGSPVSETLTDDAISNCDIIRVDASDDLRNNWELDGVNKVFKVNVTINGKKVGKARITVTFESDYYNKATATYDVEVTEAGTTNFSWTEGSGSPEYYTYAGDFMMLPALTGNSNGNYNYSSGAKNSSSYTEGGVSHSALHAYEYERKWDGSKFNIKWNNKNIKIGEGFPDFAIVTDGISKPGTASVFFGRGEGSNHPDTLMVFCETAGDVKLRAYDPQDHTKYCDATIHILPIDKIEGTNAPATTVTSSMTYPYTWDFTTNFDMANMVGLTDQYWMPIKDNNGNPTGEYTNGYGFFNLDWADVDKDNATNDRIYKHFIIGASNTKDGYMHQFNGMMLQLKGASSWANKMDRMRILNYDGTNNRGRLQFIGSYHTLKIHVPTTLPSSFKIFVKASGTGKLCIMGLDEKAVSGKEKSLTSDPQIYSFDNTDVSYMGSEGYILLGFDDARVDWIAMSTEARTLMCPNNTTYAAATYSYNEDLDLIKSNEANGVTAYYASNFTVDKKDVSAGSTNGEETQYAVMMKPLTSLNNGAATYVTANKGILLKKSAAVDADCYMIANPRNVDSYSASETITGDVKNYLVGTGANSADIAGRGKDGDVDYTNFLMAYAYKYYTDVTNPNSGSEYRFDRDWSFYPLIVSGTYNLAAQRCYLKIPGNLYVDRDGNLVEMPSSSRRSAGESAEAPATKAALSIVFDDDPLTGQGTTGISTVATETTIDSDAWYTLQGVRVDVPAKGGIYIHKGRKIVVK